MECSGRVLVVAVASGAQVPGCCAQTLHLPVGATYDSFACAAGVGDGEHFSRDIRAAIAADG